jgi:hypothetical protein
MAADCHRRGWWGTTTIAETSSWTTPRRRAGAWPSWAVINGCLGPHLSKRGVSRELWPERLEVLETLPKASGSKVAKGELRQLAERTWDLG